jgi:hypothetical protein
MMRLTELKRQSQIDVNLDNDFDENGINRKEVNANDANEKDEGVDDEYDEPEDDDADEEEDIFNRVTNLNGDLLPNGHRTQKSKKYKRKNVKSQKDKLEKLMQHKINTETLFMKFFKYILLNLTFALNVSIYISINRIEWEVRICNPNRSLPFLLLKP